MNPIIKLLPKILVWTELAGIIITVAGMLFKVFNYTGFGSLLMVGIMTLATTYFLSAYTVVELPQSNEKSSFADLLPLILRKVMFIGLAVYWVGFLFAILHLKGANEMITIGMGTLVIGAAVAMVLVLGRRERMVALRDPLLRTVATLLFYFTLPFFK
jgi:hypothetical protein